MIYLAQRLDLLVAPAPQAKYGRGGEPYLIVQLGPESTANIASSAFAIAQNQSSKLLPALSHLTRLGDLASGMVVAKINNSRRKCA